MRLLKKRCVIPIVNEAPDSVAAGVSFADNPFQFQVTKQILLREHANFGETPFAELSYPVRIADLASTDGNQVEFLVVEPAEQLAQAGLAR